MKQSYAVVTGASSGIGRALAIELAAKNINLILVALPDTGLSETALQISNEYNVEVKFCELDLTKEGAAHYFYNWCKGSDVRIKMLINNAGLGSQCAFENTTVSELETMLKLNNQALVMLAYYFLPELKLNSPAHILNVGSLASFMSIPGKAVYSASKSFICSFSFSLRMELRSDKINVSCLCPGATITNERVINNIKMTGFAGKGLTQNPKDVAHEAVRQMFRGKKLIIPGWHNKFLYKLWAFLPQRAVDFILTGLFFNKEKSERMKFETAAISRLV
jgi:uncharacterized protein